MLIADKYEVKAEVSLRGKKTVVIKFILPRILYREKPGIVDQFKANCLFEIIDDFPLN